MQNSSKIIKILFSTIILLPLIFIMLLFTIIHNINTAPIKNQLHDIILKKTGLTLKINGEIKLKLFPRLNLSANDIELWTSKSFAQSDPLMSIKHLKTTLDPFSLLGHTIVMDKVYMDDVQAHLQTNKENQVNWLPLAPAVPPELELPYQYAFNASTIMFKHLNLRYDNNHSDTHWQLKEAQLLTKDINLSQPIDLQRFNYSHLLRDLNIMARLRAQSLIFDNHTFTDINTQLKSHNHHLTVTNIEFNHAGGHGTGQIQADFTNFVPTYQMDFNISGIESMPTLLQNQALTAESTDIALHITSQGHGKYTLQHQAQGEISIHSINGEIHGVSLQATISNLNTLMLQGKGMALAIRTRASHFNHLNAHLTLNNGLLSINDMLLANNDFNLTSHGFYNLKNNRLDLFLLLALLSNKHEPIQHELDQFFYQELRNTIPISLSGPIDDLDFMVDVDFIDVNKMILGKSMSHFLKRYDITPYSEDAQEIKKMLYQKLHQLFNEDEDSGENGDDNDQESE